MAAAVLPSREVTVRTVTKIGFGIYTDEEVKSLSVKRISNPVTVDSFGNNVADGLYDPALGPFDNREHCVTCGLGGMECPGHFGHIDLPVPVYNPLNIKELYRLLRSTCFHCYRLRMRRADLEHHSTRLRYLLAGDLLNASTVTPGAHDDDEAADPDFADALKDRPPPAKFGRLTSNVLAELQAVMASVFKSVVTKRCPHCECLQPQVKRVGKFKFMISPLSSSQIAKNLSKGIQLKSIFEQVYDSSVVPAGDDDHNSSDVDETDDADEDTEGDEEAALDGDALDVGDPGAETGGGKRKRTEQAAPGQTRMTFAVGRPQYITPPEVQMLIRRLWLSDGPFLDLLFQCMGGMLLGPGADKPPPHSRNADLFFIKTVLIPPNKFRPVSVVNDDKFEHSHNVILGKVLQSVLALNDLQAQTADKVATETAAEQQDVVQVHLRHSIALQNHVSQLIDSTCSENTDGFKGIRQLLEKKEGLFRMNMMGKRVNFAARSVISPDPNIGTGEIGVPPFFASRLSYPELVTHYNVSRLRELVINGPDVYPGAVAVEDTATGIVTKLAGRTRAQREGYAKQLLTSSQTGSGRKPRTKGSKMALPGSSGKIVYRHLQDGDIMLTNRQPTLHKPGLMAHRARVLRGERTIRFHYANCATFNADFDGDEINLHLPQEQQGRAEGYYIVHADHQFMVPTDGKPVRGLIQDHVIAAVMMTKRNTFLDRRTFLQLCHIACSSTQKPDHSCHAAVVQLYERPIPVPVPAILKPEPLWTGKQVINTVLAYHLEGKSAPTFESGCKVTAAFWGADALGGENRFHMRDGYLVHGTMDKAQYGGGGLLHVCQELYGGAVAGALTSSLSRLFTAYCQIIGFTCSMGDLLLTPEHEERRAALLQPAEAIAVATGAAIAEITLPKTALAAAPGSELLRACEQTVRAALRPRYRQNAELGQVHDQRCSGALNPCASSVTNSCFPFGLARGFLSNCMSLMTTTGAKGGLVNFSQIAAMLGQQDLEGRRVPRMASGKTLPCFHAFDAGARSNGFIADRFLTGLRPQEYYFHCMAGREGLVDTAVKTARSGYLQRCMIKNLEGLKVEYDYTVRDESDGSVVQFLYGEDSVDVLNTAYISNFSFLQDNVARVVQDLDLATSLDAPAERSRQQLVHKLLKRRAKALAKGEAAVLKLNARAPPVLGVFPPTTLGVTSESFGDRLTRYLAAQAALPDGEDLLGASPIALPQTATKQVFDAAMKMRYMRSLVAPGESVGIIAGQSIGEPSTQMTLNTFHMAGRGEANVTLGIPRLRELLMTAARHVKTPVMKLTLRPGRVLADAEALAARMRKLRLAECLKGLAVEERPMALDAAMPGGRCKQYVVALQFHPLEAYPAQADVQWDELAGAVEVQFAAKLDMLIAKELRQASYRPTIEISTVVDGSATKQPSREGDGEKAAQEAVEATDLNDSGEVEGHEDDEVNEEFQEAKDADRGQEQATYESEEDDQATEVDDGAPAADAAGAAEDPTPQPASSSQPQPKRVKTSSGHLAKYVHIAAEKGLCEVVIKLPLDAPKLLVLELAEVAAAETFVRHTKGIDKVFVLGGDAGAPPSVQVDGINFAAAWERDDLVDIDSITCNDVAAMLQIYGVEAARATLVSEVRGVFGAYGIGVDYRHLSLIADFMTAGGGYRSCNRSGIESCTSPLLKMSFETSAHFLQDAALRGASDSMSSAAARIVLGQPVALGTGCVSLHMDLSAKPSMPVLTY